MYVDSAILIKLVVREPDSLFYVRLLEGSLDLRSSDLAVTECRSVLERKRREGELDAATCEGAWRRLGACWQRGGGLVLHPVTRRVLDEAGAIIAECIASVPLRTLDAIHLATCRLHGAAPLVANDRVMRQAARLLGLPLSDLPG
jgi:predicted nucleic acid-binding protein